MITEYDFTYCPQCATKFEKKEDHLSCPNCHLSYYINPKPTNAVVLKNEQDEVLLVERKNDPKKGFWDLPGGFIEENETIENSVHREVQEELGIQIKNLQYRTSFYDTYEYDGIKYYTICVLFEADMVNPQDIKPADDVASYQFFSTTTIPYDHFAFEPMKVAMQKLFSV